MAPFLSRHGRDNPRDKRPGARPTGHDVEIGQWRPTDPLPRAVRVGVRPESLAGEDRDKPGHDEHDEWSGLESWPVRSGSLAILVAAASQHTRDLRTFVDRLFKLPRCPAITDRMQRGNVSLQVAVEPAIGAAPVAQYDAVRRYFA